MQSPIGQLQTLYTSPSGVNSNDENPTLFRDVPIVGEWLQFLLIRSGIFTQLIQHALHLCDWADGSVERTAAVLADDFRFCSVSPIGSGLASSFCNKSNRRMTVNPMILFPSCGPERINPSHLFPMGVPIPTELGIVKISP